ncbi:MAG: ribonuclease P protein component 1 [Euryarchaeota archaeon]|nr:ribonuclease P protein component 1 [Euryarchaeota archaeon]
MITAQNLKRHELIGLKVKVVAATNPPLVGIEGRVVDETMNMLVIEEKGKEKAVPKKEVTLEIDTGTEKVKVVGREILGRPEDRIKRTRR